MQLSGAQILVQSLKAENVEYVFGYPGGAVIEIYDAIFQLKKFHHVLVRHEQAAVHAADAYSRSSNGEKIGVALVTSGPGATNAITGIATANSDSVPLVVISGQVGTPAIGTDAFQEVDTIGISRPCVKHNFLVTHVNDLAKTVKKAFQLARTGRPGVVVIDVPKDVTQAMAKFSYPQEDINIRSYQPITHGHTGQIKKAVQVLAAAKRPIVLYGGGAILSNASEILTDFIQHTGTPCASTLMGLGAFPSTSKQFLGMVGMHGSYEANLALQNADVVVIAGARLDDRVISVPEKFNNNALEKWWKTIENWRSNNSFWYDNTGETIKPQFVIATLAKITANNAIVTSDVGQHQMFTAQHYPFIRPRQWLNSGGLGTMGVGLPYAMGAKLANPKEDVFCITGEGSIQMNIQELSTCYQYRLPIKVINLNNGFLGMVRQWQELYYENRYSETYMDSLPDFVRLAEAYGHVGIRVEKSSDVEGALREAIALKDRLVFMDFITDRTQNVLPMVGNGKGLDEMVLPQHMQTNISSNAHDHADKKGSIS